MYLLIILYNKNILNTHVRLVGHFTHLTNSCKVQQNLFKISLTKIHDLIISSTYTRMQDSIQDALCKVGHLVLEKKGILSMYFPHILTNSKGVGPFLDSCFFPPLKGALC